MNTTNKAGEVQKISTAFWEANFSMIFFLWTIRLDQEACAQ